MAQLVKCLPCKDEDLSLISRTHMKKMSMVFLACHLSAGEAETRISMGLNVKLA